MKKTLIAAALVAACAAVPAHAGLKLPGMGRSDAATAADAAPSADALVTSFAASQAMVVNAQASLADALDLKDEVLKLQAEQKRLSSGQNDIDAMKKTREFSDAAQAAIDAKLATQPQLTAEQRAAFAKSLLSYAEALVGARNLLLTSQQYVASMGANPMGLLGGAKSALWVGKQVPGYVKGLGTSSKQLFDYARRNNIKTPANATAALDGL